MDLSSLNTRAQRALVGMLILGEPASASQIAWAARYRTLTVRRRGNGAVRGSASGWMRPGTTLASTLRALHRRQLINVVSGSDHRRYELTSEGVTVTKRLVASLSRERSAQYAVDTLTAQEIAQQLSDRAWQVLCCMSPTEPRMLKLIAEASGVDNVRLELDDLIRFGLTYEHVDRPVIEGAENPETGRRRKPTAAQRAAVKAATVTTFSLTPIGAMVSTTDRQASSVAERR